MTPAASDFPDSYRHSRYDYHLLECQPPFAVYEAEALAPGRCIYEVIKLRWKKGWPKRGIPDQWGIPKTSEWGKYAWSAQKKHYAVELLHWLSSARPIERFNSFFRRRYASGSE